MRDYFHCYSKRLACFIMAFGIRYEKKLINQKNGMPYYTFTVSYTHLTLPTIA